MAKVLRMELIEARAGKPIAEVLADLYAERGKVQGVADALGITRQNLWIWMKLLGITTADLRRMAQERDGGQAAKRASSAEASP